MVEKRINNLIKERVLNEITQVLNDPKHIVDDAIDKLWDDITNMINSTKDADELENLQEQIDDAQEAIESLESAVKTILITLDSRNDALFNKRF